MSKHKKDYTKYAKAYTSDAIQTEYVPVLQDVCEEICEEVPAIEVRETKEATGVVTKCEKLNVRSEADMNAQVMCVIDKGTEVVVLENESKNGFYKVCLPSGIEGYCKKDFIALTNA